MGQMQSNAYHKEADAVLNEKPCEHL